MESFNKTLLKIIRIAHLQGKNNIGKEIEVQSFLFQYRSTPHTVPSLPPAELLRGKKLRDELPVIQLPHYQGTCTETEWQIVLQRKECPGKVKKERVC